MDSDPLSRPVPAAEKAVADKDFAQRHPLAILIADDNDINRRVLSLLLQRLGYQVEATVNGRDCVEAALHRPFDLLLIDINMPDISGIECTQQIRRAGRDFPIVAVTATAPEESRAPSFAAGMNGFMSKPVQLPELKRVLQEASLAKQQKTAALPTAKPLASGGEGPKVFGAGNPLLCLIV